LQEHDECVEIENGKIKLDECDVNYCWKCNVGENSFSPRNKLWEIETELV